MQQLNMPSVSLQGFPMQPSWRPHLRTTKVLPHTLRSKNQWALMVQELLGFAGLLGYSEVSFRCDNEPTLLQLQRYVINARLSMGLPTLKASPPPYSHSNGLVENVVGRIRPLAGSLMHYMSEQVGIDFSSNSPWWSWGTSACKLAIQPVWSYEGHVSV